MVDVRKISPWRDVTVRELEIIRKFPPGDANISEISKTVKLRYGNVYENIPKIEDKGIIERTEKRYKLTDKGIELRHLLMQIERLMFQRK